MSACCPHSDDEHHFVRTCQHVTHYPSEDYPCLCTGFEPADDPTQCARCEHDAGMHKTVRVCRPANDEICGCHA